MQNLTSFAGIFILMGFAWVLSTNRRVVNWRVIGWGVGLQMLFAAFIFLVPAGSKFFLFVNDLVVAVMNSANAGSRFLFGALATPPGEKGSMGFFLAFQALPTIIFFSAIMGALYYMGLMPWLIRKFASVFTRLMRISGAESLCAASNIFVGVESAMTIRPYIERMTRSELHTILAVGMASIASNVMAFYVFILKGQFPTIAGHLVSASILSAPAAVVMSKLMLPETGEPVTLGMDVKPMYERPSSVIEATINGANEGLKLVVGIAALLIAFLGIMSLLDSTLTWAGGHMGLGSSLSLTSILGYIFYPFTRIIGVSAQDAVQISRIIGERVVATEVKSYQDLAALLQQGALHDPRSAFLAAYALCGFAHVASLAIFVGGISALVPSRTADLSALGFRALVAATLACLMTAAVAGTFYTQCSILFGGG